jgi:hypothetical protein
MAPWLTSKSEAPLPAQQNLDYQKQSNAEIGNFLIFKKLLLNACVWF